MRINVLPICLFLSAAAGWAAEPAWQLAPPDAKILFGVDVRGLRNSSLSDSMTPQTRAQMQGAAAMFHMPGIELLDDIDSVFLASTGDFASPTAAPKPAAAGQKNGTPAKTNAPFLLVISGTFPDEHLRPLLKGAHPSYKGINVYRNGGADSTSLAILDEHTVLLGDDKSIFRAIDRSSTGAQPQGELFAHARSLAAGNDIWFVARDTSGALQKSAGPGAEIAAEIEGVDVGLAVRDGFNMNIAVATKTEAGAQMLSQLISTQMQLAVNTKLDSQKAADFWRKVKVGADGKHLLVQVAMTKEELQENIRMMQEQRASAFAAGSAAAARNPAFGPGPVTITPAVPPKPAGPRVVKIYGLDDGVREIKLDPQP